MGSAAGPRPGSFYSVPLVPLLVVIGLICTAAWTTVVRRPRGFAFFAGAALLRMDGQRPWMEPVGWLLLASVPATLLLVGWSLGGSWPPGQSPWLTTRRGRGEPGPVCVVPVNVGGGP